MMNIDPSWSFISKEFTKDYFKFILQFLKQERMQAEVFPPEGEIFSAFSFTPFDKVKCVILGQDPYHGPGQAHGLSFSVKKGVKPPPSLQNIFKELNSDLEIVQPSHGDLTQWAQRGVFLLNSILTVRAHKPASHRASGWEEFTDEVIKILSDKDIPIVFILWGAFARSKKHLISDKHLVIESSHPSPMSAYNGFFGSKPFSRTNDFLKSKGLETINWRLDG
jgi:uracil-DNA glycosylase